MHLKDAMQIIRTLAFATAFSASVQVVRAAGVVDQKFTKFSDEFWNWADGTGNHNFSRRPAWSREFWSRQGKSQFAELLDKANSGDIDAGFKVAVFYDNGYGVPPNHIEAERWFQKIAGQGDADAQFLLGRFYYHNAGDLPDSPAENWSRKAALKGHALAQYMLVLTLESKAASWGESIGRNREAEALRWLTEICSLSPDQLADQQERFFERFPSGLYAHRKGRHDMVSAAKRILGYSNYLMGRHYEYGRGVSRDIVKSTKYYQTASGYGNPDAQDCLGVCYALGLGVEQDYSKAVQMFRKLADHRKFGKGAQCNLGFCYKNGMGVKRDYRLAAIWYGKAADRSFDETLKEDGGDPMAQYQLGLCYEYGLGVPRDGAKAFYWYDRAAKTRVSGETFFDLNLYHLQPASFRRNNAKDENKRRKLVYNMIQCKIADCYAHGVGVGKDLKEAERLYRFVGEDDPEAMCRLGKLYVVGGSGVEKNVIEAVRLFRLAARGNHREAQYNLGYCYENGLGVRPDDKMALFWYMQSADNGDADAQYKVAKYNQGIFNNAKDAASYFAKAAGQGHAESQYELGVCYRDGKGVEKDVNESRKWFSLAAKQKNQDAVTALEKMESPKPAQGK